MAMMDAREEVIPFCMSMVQARKEGVSDGVVERKSHSYTDLLGAYYLVRRRLCALPASHKGEPAAQCMQRMKTSKASESKSYPIIITLFRSVCGWGICCFRIREKDFHVDATLL